MTTETRNQLKEIIKSKREEEHIKKKHFKQIITGLGIVIVATVSVVLALK